MLHSSQKPAPINYQQGIKEILELNEVMSKMQKGFSSIGTFLTGIGQFNEILSVELPKLYDKDSVYRAVIVQFSEVFARLNVVYKNAVENVKQHENYFKDWAKQYEIAKKVKTNHDSMKKSFDHYSQKIEKLRKKKAESEQKNKAESTKDIQRLQRNEVKYQNAQRQFTACFEESQNKINDIYISRLDNIHYFVIGNMKEMSAKLDDKLSEIHNPKTSFEKCKQEILRQRQDQRIKRAIDNDMIIITQKQEEKQKVVPPKMPELEISVRRKSLKIEMNEDKQQENGRSDVLYGAEYTQDYKASNPSNSNYYQDPYEQQQQQQLYHPTIGKSSSNYSNTDIQVDNNSTTYQNPSPYSGSAIRNQNKAASGGGGGDNSFSPNYFSQIVNNNQSSNSSQINNNSSYNTNWQQQQQPERNQRMSESNAHQNTQLFSQRSSVSGNMQQAQHHNNSNYNYNSNNINGNQGNNNSGFGYNPAAQNNYGAYKQNEAVNQSHGNKKINQGMNNLSIQHSISVGGQQNQYNNNNININNSNATQNNAAFNKNNYNHHHNHQNHSNSKNVNNQPHLQHNQSAPNPFDDLLDD